MARITERREVRVEGDHGTFVFAVEPDAGRLVVREERGDGDEEMCALTISDRDELSAFLQGLRRALGVADGETSAPIDQRDASRSSAGEVSQGGDRAGASSASGGRDRGGGSTGDPGGDAAGSAGPGREGGERRAGGSQARGADDEDSRRQAMERARARGQTQAFAPWTRDEEQRLLQAVEAGRDLDDLAREHQRSRRALQLRLERLRG